MGLLFISSGTCLRALDRSLTRGVPRVNPTRTESSPSGRVRGRDAPRAAPKMNGMIRGEDENGIRITGLQG